MPWGACVAAAQPLRLLGEGVLTDITQARGPATLTLRKLRAVTASRGPRGWPAAHEREEEPGLACSAAGAGSADPLWPWLLSRFPQCPASSQGVGMMERGCEARSAFWEELPKERLRVRV